MKPWPTVTGPVPEREKLGAWIVSGRLAFAVTVPEVPVMVRLLLPGVAVLLTVTVSVLVPVVVTGEKDAVTPAGSPAIERFTEPVKPYSGTTEIVDVLDEP